jgi:hypothetical protein
MAKCLKCGSERMKMAFYLWLALGLLIGVFLFLGVSCTPAQRSHCAVCEATGLCRLMGDDPNWRGRPKYGLFDSRGWGDRTTDPLDANSPEANTSH